MRKYVEFDYGDEIHIHEVAGFWERLMARFIDFPLAIVALVFIPVLGNWLYRALMQSTHRQATVGQLTMNIMVVDIYGDPINFGSATVKHWTNLINVFTLGISYFSMLFDDRGQCIHDNAAKVLVVKSDPVEIYPVEQLEDMDEAPLILDKKIEYRYRY